MWKGLRAWGKRDFASQSTEKSERMGLLNDALGQWEELFKKKKKRVSSCACIFFSGHSLS